MCWVMAKVRTTVRFRGRVQGVGFRFHAVEFAKESGVTGWIRNRDDGTVEAVFEGEEQAVRFVIERCKMGIAQAHVSSVEATNMKYTGEFSSFSIR